MQIKSCSMQSFSVIGKEGSTKLGNGFIERLWQDATIHFHEIEPLVKQDANGVYAGFWGAMSDFSLSFQPWENHFSEGLYLAGAEVNDNAEPPEGWVKWTIPANDYLSVRADGNIPEIFSAMLGYIAEHGYQLAGAVHDYISPEENGQKYMFFPVKAKK